MGHWIILNTDDYPAGTESVSAKAAQYLIAAAHPAALVEFTQKDLKNRVSTDHSITQISHRKPHIAREAHHRTTLQDNSLQIFY